MGFEPQKQEEQVMPPPHGVSPEAKRVITVAVAGNPNAGKSILLNAVAGSRLHVGNWPGVTVEKKEAVFSFEGQTIRLVDHMRKTEVLCEITDPVFFDPEGEKVRG